jgi:hypothetical protein
MNIDTVRDLLKNYSGGYNMEMRRREREAEL